ncbi:MAG: ATP-binding protein [Firmicutes bacterium]|nr:ATP-binding protein [Bacillota bacterium]
MQRLIPNKTKVRVELFRGVTVGDLIVCGIGLALLVFVITSNLPWKWGISVAIVGITALLLVRLDEQPNYIYFLHILSFLGYKRKFERAYTDEMIIRATAKGERETMVDEIFEEEDDDQDDAGKKKKKVSGKAKARAEEKAEKQKAAEEKRLRKEEDKLLKSKDTPEEEKQRIYEERAEREKQQRIHAAAVKDAWTKRDPMNEIIPFTAIKDGYIEYLKGNYYGAVLEIDPVEFRFFSEHRRTNSIENCLGRILRSLHANFSANIVKIEKPILYDRYLEKEYQKLEGLSDSYENGVLSEEELKARVEIEYDRINELRGYCNNNHVVTSFYYLVLFESDRRLLDVQIRDAQQQLQSGELTVRRLYEKDLAVFLKYTNQIDFDERDVEKVPQEDLHLWAQPNIVDIRPRRVEVNHIITHNFRVVNYPTIVGDAWLAGLMSIPGTKVVLKCRPMERAKAIRNIDHSLTELRGQWSATGVDSRRMEIETHIQTLQELLATLQSDSESLLEVNIYVTAYDIMATRANDRIPQPAGRDLPHMTDMKKNIRRTYLESGFRLNNMEFEQVQAFIASQVSALDPLAQDGRGISSNTVAACFPWIFAHISDEGGIKLGESDGIPVFIDFFRRDSERVNSNMVIVGKSGSGKSYATKSLLANMAAEDAKIFILDPENEYTELAHNLHGQIINVGNAMYGRLNPFHIITALDDDEAGESGPSGSYATHLQFLEEFFKQIMPDCEKDAMEYLNTLVDHMYLTHNITGDTDLSALTPEDYPIFDDLYDEVLQEFQNSDNVFTRDLLRSLMNYIAKFSTGGRNANIWNGPSTITTDENFTVFNFQSMLANRNSTIANAQMLLVLKYIDNEIIKNRDYNLRYKANRRIVVVIDEAHVFIDTKFPIALDFMFQLAKRIRKYNGMQIVITQNIKDFVGSEELARKSTAIINACQYSFIFALAPNDIQDLIKLYQNAGGINENEQEQIVQAPRGQAFTIMSPSSRSTFTVQTTTGIQEMFEENDYQSRYFLGEKGAQNWEDFVGISRAAHEATVAHRKKKEAAVKDVKTSGGVNFRVFDEEEYASLQESEPKEESRVTLHVEEEPTVTLREVSTEPATPLAQADLSSGHMEPLSQIPTPGRAGGDQAMAVFDMIASALGRMADAAERGKSNGLIPQAEPVISEEVEEKKDTSAAPAVDPAIQAQLEALRRKEEELEAMRRQMDEQLKKLQEENEKLRMATAAPVQEEPEQDEDSDFADFAAFAALMGQEEEPAGAEEEDEKEDIYSEEVDEDEDIYSEEEDGDLTVMFADDFDESDEDEDEFTDEDLEDEGIIEEDEEDIDDDDLMGDDDDFADLFDEDEDLEDEEDEEEDDEDDDDDFMSSFCSFAASLMNMTAFERMRADGKETSVITLEELIKEADAQRERRRRQ